MREMIGLVYTATCATATENMEGLAVQITGATNGVPVVSLCAAAAKPDGVILRGGKIGEPIRVGKDGILMCVAGAAIAAVGEVEINAEGKVITKASGTAFGKVLSTAADEQVVPVFIY